LRSATIQTKAPALQPAFSLSGWARIGSKDRNQGFAARILGYFLSLPENLNNSAAAILSNAALYLRNTWGVGNFAAVRAMDSRRAGSNEARLAALQVIGDDGIWPTLPTKPISSA
jgi:hypothetical protein